MPPPPACLRPVGPCSCACAWPDFVPIAAWSAAATVIGEPQAGCQRCDGSDLRVVARITIAMHRVDRWICKVRDWGRAWRVVTSSLCCKRGTCACMVKQRVELPPLTSAPDLHTGLPSPSPPLPPCAFAARASGQPQLWQYTRQRRLPGNTRNLGAAKGFYVKREQTKGPVKHRLWHKKRPWGAA